jgi:hypothetical protein
MNSSYWRPFLVVVSYTTYTVRGACVRVWCADGSTSWMEVELWVCRRVPKLENSRIGP